MVKMKIPKCQWVGVSLLLALSLKPHQIYASSLYGGGTGTANDPYLISTAEELKQMNVDITQNGVDTTGVYYKLTANIDFSGYDTDDDASNGNWTPIGNSSKSFNGYFDGDYHSISNINVTRPTENYVGFFGYMSNNSSIQKLSLKDINISGASYVGGLAGYLYGGPVQQASVTGTIRGTGSYVGGLLGSQGGNVQQSYVLGEVIGTSNNTGGLIGYQSSGAIKESYAAVTLSDSNHGGLVGKQSSSLTSLKNSYWASDLGDIKSSSTIGRPVLIDALTTGLAFDVLKGFDFNSTWTLCKGGYPSFQWESPTCSKVSPDVNRMSGSGSSTDPYLIQTPEQLIYFNRYFQGGGETNNYHFHLGKNINFSGYDTDEDISNGNWTPIGNSTSYFGGTFDGNGHVISNINVTRPTENYVGFFGYMSSNSSIQKLSLKDINISGASYVGGLAGYMYGGSVQQTSVTGTVRGTGSSVGGLLGSQGGNVQQSYVLGEVIGTSNTTGGLIGYQSSGAIKESYAAVTLSNANHGGLVGSKSSSLTSLKNSYWASDLGDIKSSSTIGQPVLTDVLTTSLAFDVLKGFDFNSTWTLCKGGYPSFQWESSNCSVVKPDTNRMSGSGSSSDPYLIETPEQLIYFNRYFQGGGETNSYHFHLGKDIDFKGKDVDQIADNGNWIPIGNSTSTFKGTFDGNGHIISNISIILPNKDHVGFFGYLQGVVKNVILTNLNVEGGTYVGGLIGYASSGTIEKSSVSGTISGAKNTGGLIGYTSNGPTISQTSSSGVVNGTGDYTGGLIGSFGASLTDSYSLSDVNGTRYVGGLIGNASSGKKLQRTFSSGAVTGGNSYVGCFMGGGSSSSRANNYCNITVNSTLSTGIATGLEAHQMKGEAAKTYLEGFDFENVWEIKGDHIGFYWEPEVVVENSGGELTIDGTIQGTILSINIPNTNLDFSLNPNLEAGQQFIAPEFEVTNQTHAPLKIGVKTFEQTTDVFNDVLPNHHQDWNSLDGEKSKDFALGLVPEPGEGWTSLTEGPRYVADNSNYELGTIKSGGTVTFGFEAKHGATFTQNLNPQYRLTLIFGLLD